MAKPYTIDRRTFLKGAAGVGAAGLLSACAPGGAAPAAPSSAGEDTGEATDQSESDDQGTAPIDVHRHRPGACPEGPPCKGDGD